MKKAKIETLVSPTTKMALTLLASRIGMGVESFFLEVVLPFEVLNTLKGKVERETKVNA